MKKYVAFLRAINVGGHTVKMSVLRQAFESLGFSNVETFIASGNILFESNSSSNEKLENIIEPKLEEILGFEVVTFIRAHSEVVQIVNYQAFPKPAIAKAAAFNIAFLKAPLDKGAKNKLMSLKTANDDFHTHEREIYWLCQTRQSDSKFSNAVLEKTIAAKATLRGVNTVQKISSKFSS